MKSILALGALLILGCQVSSHSVQKRFLFKSLAQLAQPFIRRPKPPQQNPVYYGPSPGGLPAPPVFQVSPTAAQPVRIPPSSGQLYLPLPNHVFNSPNYQQQGSVNYAPAPIYVPPSSYGSSSGSYGASSGSYGLSSYGQSAQYNLPQPMPPSYSPASSMPSYGVGDSSWKPVPDGYGGNSIYYDQLPGSVGAPSLPIAADQQFPFGSINVSPGNIGLGIGSIPSFGVDVPGLIRDPSRSATTVFLSATDRQAPEGFTKIDLPLSVLRSVLDTGLESPTVYLASTIFAPSKDFVALSVTNSTLEALMSLQNNSTRAADLPMSAAEDIVVAIRSAAPKLVSNVTSVDLPDLGVHFTVNDGLDTELPSTSTTDGLPTLEGDMKDNGETTESVEEFHHASDGEINELPVVYLARRDAVVPADYIRVLLPDDILKELRRRVRLQKLHEHGVSRLELTEAYLAPSMSTKVAPPIGMVDVELSRDALQVLSDYANEAEKIQKTKNDLPQLELPRSVLEQLSKESSQKVRLITGGRETTVVKTGSNDVFIAPSDQKPPDGYVSIPLSSLAMDELKKNFLSGNVRSQDLDKGIPVRAYIAPADQKLPAGHVAVPLPDSLLDSVRSAPSTSSTLTISGSQLDEDDLASILGDKSRSGGGKSRNKGGSGDDNRLMKSSDTAVFMAPSRKRAPSKFRKLNLPESILEDLRQAVPIEKIADSGLQSRELTSAYLAASNEFIPPGFVSITVPETLVKILETFAENRDDVVSDDERNSTRSKGKNGSGRNSGIRGGGDGAEGLTLPRQIMDAVIDASKRTLKEILKTSRDQERRSRNRSRGRNRNRGSSGRENARTTTADAEENELDDKDDIDKDNDDYLDMYQPQYQMSPFFPSAMATYPYVDPYQYGGLWTYGPEGQASWAGDGTGGIQAWPAYSDYGTGNDGYALTSGIDGGLQNRDFNAYYYGIDGQDPSNSQYEMIEQPLAQTAHQKRSTNFTADS